MNAGPASLFAPRSLSPRSVVRVAGGTGGLILSRRPAAFGAERYEIELPTLGEKRTSSTQPQPMLGDPPAERIGFAVVGLGQVMLEQVLPAFAASRHARPVAIVSGHPDKARKVAAQYGIRERQIFDYANFDRIRDDPSIQAVYIALPNSMHAEFTIRAARAGKHVLCEKPLASTAAECQQMIDACRRANVKLMVAYRSQYESLNREIVRAVKDGKFGKLREFVSTYSIQQENPNQWRFVKRMSGGGPLPDVGIYAINAARFMSGEEPNAVFGHTVQWSDDPRFREVETAAQFVLQFPSGFTATCSCSYGTHRSQFLRLNGSDGWAELDPAYACSGLKLRMSGITGGKPALVEPRRVVRNQFALELDHFSQCVGSGADPHTPGEDGLQDLRIIEAIYESARIGKMVAVQQPVALARGPDPYYDVAA